MPEIHVPEETLRFLKPLALRALQVKLPLYAVGGCVRDWLLGKKEVYDLDLVTEGDPSPLAQHCAKLLKGRAESFGQFGTWRIRGRFLRVDFAATRKEEYPEPACLPQVSPASLEQDLFRRDFTINAMAAALTPKGIAALIDPHHGLADLQAHVLRVLHPESFRDDPTRVFRAARFICRLGLRPGPGMVASLKHALNCCIAARLSRHRICQEFLRILAEKDPDPVLRRLKVWGWLDLIDTDLPTRSRGRTAEERLGSLVLSMNDKGKEFVKSLPLDHGLASRVLEAWHLAQDKASARGPVSEQALAMVSAAYPGLPSCALRPVFLNGKDLLDAGLKPGASFRVILDEAAKVQWSGHISTRKQALAWLKRVLATDGAKG